MMMRRRPATWIRMSGRENATTTQEKEIAMIRGKGVDPLTAEEIQRSATVAEVKLTIMMTIADLLTDLVTAETTNEHSHCARGCPYSKYEKHENKCEQKLASSKSDGLGEANL